MPIKKDPGPPVGSGRAAAKELHDSPSRGEDQPPLKSAMVPTKPTEPSKGQSGSKPTSTNNMTERPKSEEGKKDAASSASGKASGQSGSKPTSTNNMVERPKSEEGKKDAASSASGKASGKASSESSVASTPVNKDLKVSGESSSNSDYAGKGKGIRFVHTNAFESGSSPGSKSGSPMVTPRQSRLEAGAFGNPEDRRRSKSIVRLEELSAARRKSEFTEEEGLNVFGDANKEWQAMSTLRSSEEKQRAEQEEIKEIEEMASSGRRMTTGRRGSTARRRISSLYGEFSSQLEAFLDRVKRSADETEETNSETESSSPQSIGSPESNGSFSMEEVEAEGVVVPAFNQELEEQAVDDLKKVFRTLDVEGNETVTLHNLSEGFKRMGFMRTSESLKQMFDAADTEKTGFLTWNQFYRFFKHLTTASVFDAEEADDVFASALKVRKPRAAKEHLLLQNVNVVPISCCAKRIKTLSLCPGNNIVCVAARDDNKASIVSLFGGTPFRVLSGHNGALQNVAFSSNKKHVATCSRDCLLGLWDATVGHQTAQLRHPGIVTCCAFSYSGDELYTGCQDNRVRVFSVKGAKSARLTRIMRKFPNSEQGVIVTLATQRHANEHVLVGRSCDTRAMALSATTLELVAKLEGHSSFIWSCGYSSDGRYAVTNCEKKVVVWDVKKNYTQLFSLDSTTAVSTRPLQFNRPQLWITTCFLPSEFGPQFAIANTDGTVCIVDVKKQCVVLDLSFKTAIYCLSSTDDRSVIVCGDADGNVYRLDLS